MSDPWDNYPSLYGTVKTDSDITSDNADNILIAWPVILNCLKQFGTKEKGVRLLDYGCGTGSFAYKFYTQGFDVTGIDTSKEMIKTATSAFGKKILFVTGDSSKLSSMEKFSFITSDMTFQFIENIEKTLQDMTNALNSNGILVFAVFNPFFIKDSLRANAPFFEEFDIFEKPQKGFFKLHNNKIPVFIRTAQEYNKLLKPLGFELLLESYPLFTEDFLKKYPITNLINESEYLILGYKKKN